MSTIDPSLVLVTGAAGRLGSRVADLLTERGYSIRATDFVTPDDSTVEMARADLRDHAAALALLDGVDAVVHVANHPGIHGRPPQVVFSENVTMNANVFQGAAEQGVGRIVFVSTLQLIGSHPDHRTVVNPAPLPGFPIDGRTEPTPSNLYSLSKAVTEEMLRYYTERCGLDAVALRLPLLHQHEARFAVASGEESDLDMFEGFTGLTYDDAAALCLAALTADIEGYRVYMAGLAHRHRDLGVPELIEAFYPDVPDETPNLIDMTALADELGWQPGPGYDRQGSHR